LDFLRNHLPGYLEEIPLDSTTNVIPA